jgi:hypothetical protein
MLLRIPLIQQLKDEFPDVFQLWYADDAGGGGNFWRIQMYFLCLVQLGPEYGTSQIQKHPYSGGAQEGGDMVPAYMAHPTAQL